MLVHPSAIDLSSRTLRFLTGRLKARRQVVGTRWWRLPASRQALPALAHLRCGDTYAQPAAGFGIGIATVYRYIRETVEVLASLVPSLAEAMRTIREKAFVILDGTPLPIDRIADDTPCHPGKHKRHGMNVQVLTDPLGRLSGPRRHNTTHAKIRCLGEQAMTTLKSRRPLRKLRCGTTRITAIAQAVLLLHHATA
ncbi:transposase family protein [Streptomyces roseolus]|uniref:transposase family protein n=1 Tax=Streptomyces roseolus TaxID=67358 RepID=UPI00365BA5DF